MDLTRTIKGRNGEYIVDFRWGLEGWLPEISQSLPVSIWEFMFAYANRFIEMVKQYYGIDLELASLDEVALFYINTGLIVIETRAGGKLTNYAVRQIKAIVKFYRDLMVNESNFI